MNPGLHGFVRRALALSACCLWLACACASHDARVVILVIDGPRYSETFGDSLHTHVPGMWNTLRPQGSICSNFRNLGETLTNPGHGTLLTGVEQHIDNRGLARPAQPTLFEYYRKARGAPAGDAVLLGGKPKLDAVAHGTDSAYGERYGASTDFTSTNDLETFGHLMARIDGDAPHLVMCSFSDVDLAGHGGNWNDYLRRIEVVDSLVVLTWNHLQAKREYAGKTWLFVTADHGRHDDAHGGFQNHGDDCDGCRHIVFLALGPEIPAGHDCATAYSQRNLCTVVGRIMGFETPSAYGSTMDDLFASPSTTVRR